MVELVGLLVVGVEGGGGGRCWSPEVPTAGGVGGGCRSCWSPDAANGVDVDGGCTHDWSPGVSGAARVGGGFAGVCMKLDADIPDICPFDD